MQPHRIGVDREAIEPLDQGSGEVVVVAVDGGAATGALEGPATLVAGDGQTQCRCVAEQFETLIAEVRHDLDDRCRGRAAQLDQGVR